MRWSTPVRWADEHIKTDSTRDQRPAIAEPLIDIVSLSSSIGVGAANDEFIVRTGNANGASFRYAQVNPNGPIPVIIRNSEPIGILVTGVDTGDEVTVEVPIGSFDSASTVATGGVAFDPLSEGTTVLLTEANSFDNTWPASSQSVTATP